MPVTDALQMAALLNIKQALQRVKKPGDVLQYARAARSLFKMSDLNKPIWAVGRRRVNA